MTYYAGLDISLRTINICVIDDEGERIAESKLASDVQDIIAYLDDLNTEIECVDLENEIRGLFKVFGIKLPPKLGHGAFDAAVRDINARLE